MCSDTGLPIRDAEFDLLIFQENVVVFDDLCCWINTTDSNGEFTELTGYRSIMGEFGVPVPDRLQIRVWRDTCEQQVNVSLTETEILVTGPENLGIIRIQLIDPILVPPCEP